MSEPEMVSEMTALERRVDSLASLCERLLMENQALRQRNDQAQQDRAQLLRKHEQARSRVEAMIGQLRSMESS